MYHFKQTSQLYIHEGVHNFIYDNSETINYRLARSVDLHHLLVQKFTLLSSADLLGERSGRYAGVEFVDNTVVYGSHLLQRFLREIKESA